jgi:hypothetical protein
MITEEELWDLIDGWFAKEVKANEAITTGYDLSETNRVIKIKYARITNNTLFQDSFSIDMRFLLKMPDSTVIIIIKDVLNVFRKDEEP